MLWVTLSIPRGLGCVRNGFGLLLFHSSYWGSVGHLTFLLVFRTPSCFLLVCLMATVPQGCRCPGIGHPQPQCLRVVPDPALVTHSRSHTGMSLPSVGRPWAAGCPLLTWSSSFQECISSSISPQLSYPLTVSLRVSRACLLPAMAAGVPEICLSWGAVGSSAWLQLWCVTVTHTGFRGCWTQLWLALGSSWLPSTLVPTTAPAAETQPCMPHAWGNISQVRLRDKETIFFREWADSEKGCSMQGRHVRSEGIAEIHLSLYR